MSFYGLIWRLLPGPVAVKAVLAGLLVVVVVAVLFTWVFPALEPSLPGSHITVDG